MARDLVAPLVVANEATPACYPAEAALDHSSAGGDLEALLLIGLADDLNKNSR